MKETQTHNAALPILRVLNLGAGVQSSTLYEMAIAGEFEHAPEVALFADTEWEPKHVYDHLQYLEQKGGHIIPIRRVGAGSIRLHTIRSITEGRRFASLPAHVLNLQGKHAMLRRQCTREFKIEPLTQATRGLLGLGKGQRAPNRILVERWLGISLDEYARTRDSREHYAVNVYPLIDRRMTRKDCIAWLEAHGCRIPSKSACIGCPFHDDGHWRDMKANRPEEFADAVEFDAMIRTGLRGVDCEAFLHRSLVPLDQVDFSTLEDRGQLNMFINECEGICGV